MAELTFRASVRSSGRGGGHLVDVPPEVVEAVLGVQKAIMAEAGVSVVDTLTLIVRNDEAPRQVDLPEDLAEAFGRHDEARVVFEGLSFSHKREYVRSITDAKRPETRARHIQLTIHQLVERASGNSA